MIFRFSPGSLSLANKIPKIFYDQQKGNPTEMFFIAPETLNKSELLVLDCCSLFLCVGPPFQFYSIFLLRFFMQLLLLLHVCIFFG